MTTQSNTQINTTPKNKKRGKKGPKPSKPIPKTPQREVSLVDNPSEQNYGDLRMVQSKNSSGQIWTQLADLQKSIDSKVWVRTRIHRIRKKSNKMAFFLFRDGIHTVQGVLLESAEKGVTREMVKYCAKIPAESVVDVRAAVEKAEIRIKSASLHHIELRIEKVFVVSPSSPSLPFQLDSAANKFSGDKAADSEKTAATVGRALRLDHRALDLRTGVNNAIFRIQSAVCAFWREFLLKKDFIEIHTPKIVGGVSEGGAEVFKVNYFGSEACLAQSPQLYKQMAVCADLGRVFEIGPVFRAENANTHRHLTEFVGLDLEMPISEHYSEILSLSGELFVYIFDRLKSECQREIETVRESHPSAGLQYPPQTVSISFAEAVRMLSEAETKLLGEGKTPAEIEALGASVDGNKDFSTPNEKLLGKLVREKFHTDFFIVHRYPLEARPFYTMPAFDDPSYTNSFDFFMRGEEITSGAQRVHEPGLLLRRAAECGIPEEGIRSYVESFRYGTRPHGGIGVGLERVVMLFLGLENVRECSLFPRDPKRFAP